tara:strand:- start:13552 stop:14070 length:519 start_codon:yes stop_codon:yes gene_type:complete
MPSESKKLAENFSRSTRLVTEVEASAHIRYRKTIGLMPWNTTRGLEVSMEMCEKSSTQNKSSVPTGIDGAKGDHGKPGRESTTAGQWERGKILQKDTGKTCPIELKDGEIASWERIAKWISKEEGKFVCRQVIQNAFRGTLKRLEEKLIEDDFIRQWLIDNNFQIPETEGEE